MSHLQKQYFTGFKEIACGKEHEVEDNYKFSLSEAMDTDQGQPAR